MAGSPMVLVGRVADAGCPLIGGISLHVPPEPEARPHVFRIRAGLLLRRELIVKRLAAVLPLALLALVVMAPSALAAKPTHERIRFDNTYVDESCGFPVEVHETGSILAIEWVGPDGTTRRFEAAPQAKNTLTNLNTAESITVNVSGPAHITEGADGSFTLVGTGLWGWGHNPDTGDEGLFLTAGRFVFSIDAAGNPSLQRVGRLIDLCAQLAA
jgi:hypothetical protein